MAERAARLDESEPTEGTSGRVDRPGTALALATAAGVGAAVVTRSGIVDVAILVALAGAGAALHRRTRDAAALALAAAAFIAISFVPPLARLTPLPLLLALAVLLLAAGLRAPWLARGELGRAVLGWAAAIAAVSGTCLVAWWKLVRPDLSDLTLVSLLPDVSAPALLAAAVLGWSALNAVAEEFFFRGALQHALTRSLGGGLGIAVQAAAFGLLHYRGFPRGWSGVALATIYGLMLGALRRRSGGLLAPWLAHVAADVVIVGILLWMVPG